jgi:hypothetical protein
VLLDNPRSLIVAERELLFNIPAGIQQLLDDLLKRANAQMTSPNPNYGPTDPATQQRRTRRKSGRGGRPWKWADWNTCTAHWATA